MSIYKMYENLKSDPKAISVMEKCIKIFDKLLDDMKETHPEKYEKLQNEIYIAVNGYHFNEEMLKDAFEKMINDDGSKAPKWSLSETTQVAKNSGVRFTTFNECDWNYTMNMIYSDYCEVLGDSVMSYVKMADKFLNDKDAPEGKALKYAMCMKKDYH